MCLIFLCFSFISIAKMAPMAITNIPVHDYGKYDYIYAVNSAKPDEPWSFLKDMQYVDAQWPLPNYFKVKKMGEEEALTKLDSLYKSSNKKAVMFFIHGWNSGVYYNFCTLKKLNESSDYLVIPIMWNNDNGSTTSLDYRNDRVFTSPRAATTLVKLESFFSRVEQKKAWLCHSMGCYVTQFFASELDSNEPATAANIFDIVFMVAPDLRYDIFNEYPYNSGKYKNECSEGDWNDPDVPERIPDCRLGGGKALVKLAKGGVDGTNKLLVFWNKDDYAGPIREARLSLLDSTWPLSPKTLLNNGNESDRPPLLYFEDKTEFTRVYDVGTAHSYQMFDELIEHYNNAL